MISDDQIRKELEQMDTVIYQYMEFSGAFSNT